MSDGSEDHCVSSCSICKKNFSGWLYVCQGCGDVTCENHTVFPFNIVGNKMNSCCANCALPILREMEENLETLRQNIKGILSQKRLATLSK